MPAAGRQPQQLASCGMARRIQLRGTAQVPLRGPAQPLAAVRSGACEAVPPFVKGGAPTGAGIRKNARATQRANGGLGC
ncbi:TPA: hypothetical protein QEN11_08855 [Stenotrophomonas maltophilia]|nr:hypothetical protein [Stenotrophomonas maltophilia]